MIEYIIIYTCLTIKFGGKIFREFTFTKWLLLESFAPIIWLVVNGWGKTFFDALCRASFLWFHLTHSIHTVLSWDLFHPSLLHEPFVHMTSDAVSDHWLTPHEYDTEKAGYDSWIHRCDDECTTCDIARCTIPDSLHDRIGHTSITTEHEYTEEDESDQYETDAPGESLLYCTDPCFVSFFQKQSHEWTEYRELRRDEFQYEVGEHDTHEYEWNRVIPFEHYEKKCK